MKKKLIPLMLVSSLAIGATFTLASCSNHVAEELLQNLIVEQDGTTVDSNFKVAATIKKGEETYNLLWSSSEPKYLTVSEKPTDGQYDITITRPEDAKANVILTATLDVNGNRATKDFKIGINPITAIDFADRYVFPQKDAVVSEDFDLATETKIGSKTATITWAVVGNNEPIAIDATNHKAVVTGVAPAEGVRLRATFAYGGEAITKTYKLTVYRKLTAFEQVRYWYTHTGVTQTLSGYVVAKDVYSDQYSNTSIYISDATGRGGYYAYRVKCTKEEYDAMAFGSHVTVTGASNTAYKGLMETNAGGTIVVDADVAKKTEADLKVAIDDELIANTDSFFYRTSQLVSLTGWKVKEIKDDGKDASKYNNATQLVVLTKQGVDISLYSSKYVSVADADNTAVATTISGLAVNDIVDVKGILSYANAGGAQYDQKSYQICVTGADSIVKNTTYDATNEKTKADDAKAVKKAIDKTKLTNIYQAKEIDLPATVDGVTVEWSFSTPADVYTPKTLVIEDGKLKATPGEKLEEAVVVGKFTKGDFVAEQYYTINTLAKTDQELVDDEVEAMEFKIEEAGSYALPAKAELYEVVDVAYEILSQKAGETDVTVAEIKEGKLVIAPEDLSKDYTIKFKATFTYNEATETKEFEVTIKGISEFQTVSALIAAATAGSIKDKETTIYVQGIVKSVDATKNLAWITDGEKDFEVYGKVAASSLLGYGDIKEGDLVFVTGTYTVYKETTHETVGGTAKILKKAVPAKDVQVAFAAKDLALDDVDANVVDQALPTTSTKYPDVTISWALKSTSTTTTVTDNKMTCTQGDATEEVTLTATVSAEGVEAKTVDVKFTVKKAVAVVKKTINQASLGYSGTNINYASSTFTADAIEYGYTDCGAYGNGIQMKKSVNSSLFNKTAYDKDIYQIVIFVGKNGGNGTTGGTVYIDNFKFEAADNADFTNSKTLTATVSGSYITLTVPTGCKFFKITNTSGYAVYLNSVEIQVLAE